MSDQQELNITTKYNTEISDQMTEVNYKTKQLTILQDNVHGHMGAKVTSVNVQEGEPGDKANYWGGCGCGTLSGAHLSI